MAICKRIDTRGAYKFGHFRQFMDVQLQKQFSPEVER